MESSLGILILIVAVGWVVLRKFSSRSGGGYVNNYPHEIQNQSETDNNDNGCDDDGDDGGD